MPRKSPLEQHLDIVGVLPDREVAQRVGLTPENVRAWRVRRGIAAGWRGESAGSASPKRAKRAKAAPKKKPGRASKLDRFAHLFGVVPDQTLAGFSGLKAASIGARRRSEGIPAAATSGPIPRRRASKMDAFAHLLGLKVDAEVAKLAGVTVGNVAAFRRRHGIPSATEFAQRNQASAEAPAPAPKPAAAPAKATKPAPAKAAKAPKVAKSAKSAKPSPARERQWAFKVVVDEAGAESTHVVVATDLAAGAALSTGWLAARSKGGTVSSVERIAEALV